jgi:hypothetical protein
MSEPLPVSENEMRIHMEYVLSNRNTDKIIAELMEQIRTIVKCDRWRSESSIKSIAYDLKLYRRMDM